MKTIGLLGGLGPESTIAYYECITRTYYELRGDYAYPEVVMHSFNFADFIDAGYRLPDRVKAAVEGLARAGADFVIAACNSVHVVYDEVASSIPIPWLSIMEAAAERVAARGLRTVGLLGTVFTMQNDFYQNTLAEHGIDVVTPLSDEQTAINEIIYGELVRREVRDESRQRAVAIIEALGKRGAEGVILGCTELPFLITQQAVEMPVFDTTTLHAHKALELAMA